ncbi:MAG TPA: acyl carrier protein [Planctomycetaceae bacterium]|jgi:acyl carrier protein|nr:acyl carrier protein [Planctomycetaceae bacterium]
MNEASAEQKLKEILARVVGEGGKGRFSAAQLDGQAEFSTLGVNSVDLMEFVLRIENEFRVDILSDMLPDELPSTLNGWAKLLCARLDRPAKP